MGSIFKSSPRRSGVDASASAPSGAPTPDAGSGRHQYLGVILVLLLATFLATGGAVVGSLQTGNMVLFDVAITLGLATGILAGIAGWLVERSRPLERNQGDTSSEPLEAAEEVPLQTALAARLKKRRLLAIPESIWSGFRDLRWVQLSRFGTATAGILAVGLALLSTTSEEALSLPAAAIAAAVCLGAAGLAATAAYYLADIDPARLPEAPALCRGARIIAWMLILATVSMGLEWAGLRTIIEILGFVVLGVDSAVCYGLLAYKDPEGEIIKAYPLDIGVLSILGSRPNILASILDFGQRQLGIDLRSTWALTIVRRSLEPLVIALCLLAWFSTSLTVVGLQEEGLLEHWGVAVTGQPLQPGIHLHWPWPVDRVFRLPVRRIVALQIGHEGEEGGGPENVLWAVEHAPNEYTLLLGNGRDLITVDAAVQYRIVDSRAWRYHSQNPADALKAIAYRAVMRSTVNHTLTEALSQNVVTLTDNMRAMVQRDADALGLGVEVEGFTVGGMHPPVPVASAYEAVVSAELGEVTAVANANSFRNSTVPAAEATALMNENAARGEGAEALARAAGEAWSFRALESQYHSSPQDYFFRRRLEALENGLAGRRFTIIDSRFQRDGGEIWLTQ